MKQTGKALGKAQAQLSATQAKEREAAAAAEEHAVAQRRKEREAR